MIYNIISYESYATKVLDYWFVAGDTPAQIEVVKKAKNTELKADIEEIISGYIPRDTLIAIREELISILTDTLVGHYEGFLGVDQIVCQNASPFLVPVSEINLRMTMGLIARNQHDY